MKLSLVRFLVLLFAVVGLLAAYRWWTSDRRQILAAFEEMQEAVEKSGEEGALDRLAHARAVGERFADGFIISAQPYEGEITERQQLMAVVDRYRSSASTIRVDDSEVELTLRENATADLTAVVEAVGIRPGGPGRERFRIRVAWRRDDGVWRIQELEILEVLDSSGLFF